MTTGSNFSTQQLEHFLKTVKNPKLKMSKNSKAGKQYREPVD